MERNPIFQKTVARARRGVVAAAVIVYLHESISGTRHREAIPRPLYILPVFVRGLQDRFFTTTYRMPKKAFIN